MPFNLDKYKRIRSVLDKNREKADQDKKGHPHFRVDRNNASEYLKGHPKFERIINGYFSKLKREGKPIIYADICGRANANRMGADYNYSFSIQETYFKGQKSESFKGDIFNKKDVLDFINKIKANGHKLNYFTFEPIVGLEGYDFSVDKENRELHRQVVWQQLENNFCLLLEVLETGGYIYINKPFQFDTGLRDFIMRKKQNLYELAIEMKRFARRNKLRIKIDPSIGGPLFLLNKPEK